MPDSKQCHVHDSRMEKIEGRVGNLERGQAKLETGQVKIFDVVDALKSKLLGNGDPGLIDQQEERIRELEDEKKITEEVERRMSERRRATDDEPEEASVPYLKKRLSNTDPAIWFLIFMILGPKGVELFISLLKQLHQLWGG